MKQRVSRTLCYVFLIVAAFLSIFPFVWMVIGATNQTIDIYKGKLTFGPYLSQNFTTLKDSTVYFTAYVNSILVTVGTTAVSVLLCAMGGYAFEIYRSRAMNGLFGFLLLSMMIPFAAIMIPLFRMFSRVGMLNMRITMAIPYLATAFLIFFFRQSAKQFEKALVDAARIDGVREVGIFFRIFIPTMKSTFAAAIIITFMNNWNSYVWPLLVIQTNRLQTLPLLIAAMGSAYTPDYGMIMVGIVLATVPIIILFLTMQKQFVKGMLGSVK